MLVVLNVVEYGMNNYARGVASHCHFFLLSPSCRQDNLKGRGLGT